MTILKRATGATTVFCLTVLTAASALACVGAGPQTPRDISGKHGVNSKTFSLAPKAAKLNLCNIHFHRNAEHKGPGFAIFAGKGKYGGYRCNMTPKLTKAELAPTKAKGCAGIKPGDTIEVHWVHSSCAITPGKGLGSCLSKTCKNPVLRVEAQVFVVVNDSKAGDFLSYAYDPKTAKKLHQAKNLPTGTGKPVVFHGSTTGPSYTGEKCSPFKVTWSVRPQCAKIHIDTVHAWCRNNVFKEDHAHGVRELVTAPGLLAPIP